MHRPRTLSRLIALCSVVVALLAIPTVAHAQWLGPEKLLTTNASDQRWPEVNGTRVVYEDYRAAHDVGDPNDPDTLYDIYVMDLTTGKEKLLTPYHTAWGYPALSGDHVVWNDYGHGTTPGGIYHYDLKTNVRRRLPITSGRDLEISGRNVVYEAFRGGHWRIYVYDLVTGKERRITPDVAIPGAPDVSGNRVVWQDYRNGNFDIYSFDLTSGVERRITTDSGDQNLPAISGDNIVWHDDRNGILNQDIYLYNLCTGIETRVTDEPEIQWFVAISGPSVVWMDERHGDTEIYLYDITTGTEHRVTDNTWYQGNPTVASGRIIYEDHLRPEVQDMNLYETDIVRPSVTASAPATIAGTQSAPVTGVMRSSGGTPLAGKTITLESSGDGKGWTTVDTTVTAADGTYRMTSWPFTTKRYLRARFAGDAEYAPAVSTAQTVKARVHFTTPPVMSTYELKRDTNYSVWGYFLPKHAAGSHQIKVRAYHYEKVGGVYTWVYKKTFSTTTSNSLTRTTTKYKGTIRLPLTGQWRIRAYHASDSINAESFSLYRPFFVR